MDSSVDKHLAEVNQSIRRFAYECGKAGEAAVGATGAFSGLADAIIEVANSPLYDWKDRPMVFEVCVVKVDDHGNHKHVVMAPTAVVAKDENAAIVAATRKLEEGVDTNTIEVLVRPFR